MIKPWGDWIAVNDPPAEKQDGTYKGSGLVVPDGFGMDTLQTGIVVGVGPAVESPDGFEEGAKVWYPRGAMSEVEGGLKFVHSPHLVAWEPALDRETA